MNHEQAIESFKSITNATTEESKFYLETYQWDLEQAALNYIQDKKEEEGEEEEDHSSHSHPHQSQSSAPSQNSSTSSFPTTSNKNTSSSRQGGIRTFADINKDEDEEEDDEDDKTQRYFTGGEKSGLMVQSAPKEKKGSNQELVGQVFESAKKHGATPASERKPEKPDPWTTAGHQLGSNQKSGSSQPAAGPGSKKVVEVKITFWSNGFTLDDGPLRRYEDPENREFIDDIHRREVPRELESRAPPGGLSIFMVDNRTQNWTEPAKPKYVAYSGSGQALGSTPAASSSTPAPKPTATSSTSTTTTTNTSSVQVDSSQPTTSIQIRLADGTRLQSTFNQSHSLNDVINFINRSSNSNRAFDLLTGFPLKPLTIDTKTSLKDAGLLNALLTQKYK
eukprot:gene5061-6300_t